MTDDLSSDTYVCLRPEVTISLDGDPGGRAFLGDTELGTFDLDGEARSVLQSLLPLLKTGCSVGAITEHLEQQGFEREQALSGIEFLIAAGFTFRSTGAYPLHECAHYAWVTSQPEEILDRIAASSVAVLGEKKACEAVVDGLESGGIEGVRHLPTPAPLNADSPGSFDELNPEIPSSYGSKAFLRQATLVVMFGESLETARLVNRWCVSEERPLKVGLWQNDTVTLAPTYVPGVTPCLACWKMERSGALQSEDSSCRSGTTPMIKSAAHLLAGQCVEYLSGTSDADSLQDGHEIDLRTASFSTFSVLRDPRCDVCSRLDSWPEQATLNV